MHPRTVVASLLLTCAALSACGGDAVPAAALSPASSTTSGALTPTPSPDLPPSPSASAPDAQVVDLTVRGGQVSGATGRVEVPLGGEVVLRVTSDVADEVHLHGYDESGDVVAGQPGELRFHADIPGTFEVELEEAGTLLTRLLVR